MYRTDLFIIGWSNCREADFYVGRLNWIAVNSISPFYPLNMIIYVHKTERRHFIFGVA